uniref:Mediator of RNA polymerase II transcription subunit 24 n=2 Tax=Hucho hucho TaxID=62062 RepID=A0A4W5QC89_9TELE
MLCHRVQTCGSEVILSDPSPSEKTPFFETWLQTCMPEESKTLNPDHPCFRMESGKVESLVALLNNATEIKLVQMKWHEICLSTPADILEVLEHLGEWRAVCGGRAGDSSIMCHDLFCSRNHVNC